MKKRITNSNIILEKEIKNYKNLLDFIADKLVTRNTSKCYNFWLSCDKSFADNKRKYSLAEIDNNQLAAIARRRDVLEKIILLLLIKIKIVFTLHLPLRGMDYKIILIILILIKSKKDLQFHIIFLTGGSERSERGIKLKLIVLILLILLIIKIIFILIKNPKHKSAKRISFGSLGNR